MQRIKHTFYISVIVLGFMISPVNPFPPVINIGPAQIYAATHTIPTKYQTAITEIKSRQTETDSVISEHYFVKTMQLVFLQF